MAERPDTARHGRFSVGNQRAKQRPRVVTIRSQPPGGAHQLIVRKRLAVQSLFPKGAFGQGQRAGSDSFPAATDHVDAAPAKLVDLVHHVRFERGWKLVRNVGYCGHAEASSDAHNMPATVKSNPITNWY